MNVPSFEFLGFAAAVALLVHLSDSPRWRRAILVLANLGFVLSFTHDPIKLAPFAALLALGFVSLKLMESYRSRAIFVPLLCSLLLMFFWLKRYAFIPPGDLLTFSYFAVGMSYVFFRVLHLVIDAYQEALPERVGIAAYVSYTLNFTSLVSGPIQLYQDYVRTETRKPLKLDWTLTGEALGRIVVGFFKVSVLSPVLFYAQQQSIAALGYSGPGMPRVVDASFVLSLFPIYLYFNFSGYTDFVIGVARFMGLELPENFNRPFLAGGVIDFWSRWHMTLSNWLKTYVYSPLFLSLMRRFPSPRIQAYLGVLVYFVTFFLVGAWHGQTPKFLFFGLLTGFGISVNKLYEIIVTNKIGRAQYRELGTQPLYAAIVRGLNFTWFCVTMLWFWSTPEQLGGFASLLGALEIAAAMTVTLLGAAVALSALKLADEWVGSFSLRGRAVWGSQPVRAAWYTTLAVITISVSVVLNAPAPHIVYRAF